MLQPKMLCRVTIILCLMQAVLRCPVSRPQGKVILHTQDNRPF